MPAELRILVAPTVALALLGCADPKPPPPTVALTAPADTLMAPYGGITDAAWLGDDRWAVVSPDAEAVTLLDFSARTVTPLGGKKPTELQNPFSLFTVSDTLFVADWGKRRVTAWGREGRMIRAIAAPDAARGALHQAADETGQLYAELAPPPGPDGSGNRDSALVLRSSPGGESLDTVAQLAPLDLKQVVGDAGKRFERRVFSGSDQWGVLPDGSLWVARVYDNRVDWFGPDGERTRGSPLPDRVLEVTRYDREMFVRTFPPELRTTAQQLPFAAIKPPFERGFTGPASHVWLEKSRAPADSTRSYHVVDRSGRLAREIRVPGQGRILAVAPGFALVAEPAERGTRFLRYVIPPPS